MHHEVKLPKFKRYGILTKESMEIISTNLYDFVNINFSNSSNGIITGFDVEYLKNNIGEILHNKAKVLTPKY